MLGSEITAAILGISLASSIFAPQAQTRGHSMPVAAQPSGRRATRRTQKLDSGLNCLLAAQLGKLWPLKGIAASGEPACPNPACSPCRGQGGQGTGEETGCAANSPQLGTGTIKARGKASPQPPLPAQARA